MTAFGFASLSLMVERLTLSDRVSEDCRRSLVDKKVVERDAVAASSVILYKVGSTGGETELKT